jgi:hypothetical protein
MLAWASGPSFDSSLTGLGPHPSFSDASDASLISFGGARSTSHSGRRSCDVGNRHDRGYIAVGQRLRREFLRRMDGIRSARLLRQDVLVSGLLRRPRDRVTGRGIRGAIG